MILTYIIIRRRKDYVWFRHEEVLDLLRTAYLDDDWNVINDAIDLIQKHLNEKENEKIDHEWK